MLFFVFLYGTNGVTVVPLPVSIESLQESIGIFVENICLQDCIDSHFGRIVVILVVGHIAGFDVLAHAVQHGTQLIVSFLAGDGVLVVNVCLNVVILIQEVQNLVSSLFVFAGSSN